ncbi:MAG: hypothetical protein ACT4PQ_08030 [Betaproteobacteria bacterium]
MNRYKRFPADQRFTAESWNAKPWNRREFVKGLAAVAEVGL